MNQLSEDELYSILRYTGIVPRYRRVNKIFTSASQQAYSSKIIKEYMDKEYPLWDREVEIFDGDIPRETIMYLVYDIALFHMNRAMLRDEWNIFLIILDHYGIDIVPQALFMTHMANRFDISDMIIKKYSLNSLIDLISQPEYPRERYKYPILYNLFRLNHPQKTSLAEEWTKDIRSVDGIVGFIHPDMAKLPGLNEKLEHLIETSEVNVYEVPIKIDINDTKIVEQYPIYNEDNISYLMNTIPFLSVGILEAMEEIYLQSGELLNPQTERAIAILTYPSLWDKDLKNNLKQDDDTVEPSIRLAVAMVKKEPITEDILMYLIDIE